MLNDEKATVSFRDEEPTGELKKVVRKLKRKTAELAPVHVDPKQELRRIVLEHRAIQRTSTAMNAMSIHRVNRTTKERIPCRLPEHVMCKMQVWKKDLGKNADELSAHMLRELKTVPVYKHFLKHVYGVGPVVAAYMVAEIDIHRVVKSSGLRRFCGLAVINGRLERKTRPPPGAVKADFKLHYNAEMRTRVFQAFCAMVKNASKFTVCDAHDATKPPTKDKDARAEWRPKTLACAACAATASPYGTTSKYLDIMRNYKYRMQHSERYDPVANTLQEEDGKLRKGARAVINSTAWHKAADVLIEDLYIVWKTLEGLPVWPDYYAAKLGYSHGGKICVNVPKMLTLDEALELVGDVGGRPAESPVEFEEQQPVDEEENEEHGGDFDLN